MKNPIIMAFPHLLGTLTVILFTICSCIEPPENENTQKGVGIGLLLPYTGGESAVGTNYERAAMMARERINAAGGINGTPIHFVAKDTHSDPVRAVAALNEILAHEDVIAVIGPEGADVADTIYPILEQKRILFISPMVSGSDELSTSSETPWFRLAPSAATLGRAFANHLIFSQNLTAVNTVFSNDDYNADFTREFENRFVELGGVIENSIPLSSTKLSYNNEVNLMRLGTSGNVMLSAAVDSSVRFTNELSLSNQGQKWNWFLSPTLQTPVFLQNTLQGALEGAKGIGIRVDNPDEVFVDEYKKRWDDTPLDGAFFYFDALTILGLAMTTAAHSNGGELSYAGIRDAMMEVATPSGVQVRWSETEQGFGYILNGLSLYYSGLTGPLLFTEYGQQKKALMTYWTISNGQISAGNQL
ncbi:MAG: ABC transporter substrate-binding protein [Deltaproteobacteria bacterium]|nr:ABC transporter substrate-binding protein [Deltaproteobacteria bacterium]